MWIDLLEPGTCDPSSDPCPRFLPVTLSGCLIGYLVQPKQEVTPTCEPKRLASFEEEVPPEDNVIPLMDWDVVKKMFYEKVSAAKFESVFQ